MNSEQNSLMHSWNCKKPTSMLNPNAPPFKSAEHTLATQSMHYPQLYSNNIFSFQSDNIDSAFETPSNQAMMQSFYPTKQPNVPYYENNLGEVASQSTETRDVNAATDESMNDYEYSRTMYFNSSINTIRSVSTKVTKPIEFQPSLSIHQTYCKYETSLEELQRDFSNLWKSQAGCRQIERAIDDFGYECGVRAFLEQFYAQIEDIILHPFGNYVFQKLMTILLQADLTKIFELIKSKIPVLAKKPYGMRSLQAFVAAIKSFDQLVADFIKVITPYIEDMIMDSNASHVLQKSLILFDDCYTTPIVEVIAKNCLSYSKDMHACCVVQKSLDNKDIFEGSLKYQIALMLMYNTMDLVTHPYGNYVTQLLIKLKVKKISEGVIGLIKKRIVELSCDKFASHPIELAFEGASVEAKKEMVESLCNKEIVKRILFDQYGNYVIQKILKLSSLEERKRIVKEIKPYIDELSCTPNGKKVCDKIVKCYKDLF